MNKSLHYLFCWVGFFGAGSCALTNSSPRENLWSDWQSCPTLNRYDFDYYRKAAHQEFEGQKKGAEPLGEQIIGPDFRGDESKLFAYFRIGWRYLFIEKIDRNSSKILQSAFFAPDGKMVENPYH